MSTDSRKSKIIAVTGCPTGIAHTFIAEEKFKKVAKELGVDIKVETHGQIGIGNKLTEEEIGEAIGVIIAADKDVDAGRFVGKRVLEVSVSKGIKNAKELMEQILEGNVPIKLGERKETVANNEMIQKENFGRQIYKHLMNGVSYMLPFVVGGGVLIATSFLFGIYSANPEHESYNKIAALLMSTGQLAFSLMVPILSAFIAMSIGERPGMVVGFIGGLIASNGGAGFLGGIISGFLAGYIIVLLKKIFSGLPKTLEGIKPIFLYPVFGILLIGITMTGVVSPVSAINNSMMNFISGFQNSNPIVLGLIIGIMCAFDMGGPVNKAAYVTGVSLLGQGNYFFMAGVSAACITPPLIIGFATLLFRKKFNQEERSAGIVNFILGSTHITEGAIPFAAEDPIKVLPILMLGSSISAILSYIFKVQVPAPHGGFLILPVVTHGFLWVVAILIGSLVGALLYGQVKKVNKQH